MTNPMGDVEHRVKLPDGGERGFMYKMLPNGDIVRVPIPEEGFQDPMLEADLKMATPSQQVAGQHSCPHCGSVFMSPNVLAEHVRNMHAIASGQADVRMVELPDGSSVPMEQIKGMLAEKELVVDDAEERASAAEKHAADVEKELKEVKARLRRQSREK